jgi:hypothetical protein
MKVDGCEASRLTDFIDGILEAKYRQQKNCSILI